MKHFVVATLLAIVLTSLGSNFVYVCSTSCEVQSLTEVAYESLVFDAPDSPNRRSVEAERL